MEVKDLENIQWDLSDLGKEDALEENLAMIKKLASEIESQKKGYAPAISIEKFREIFVCYEDLLVVLSQFTTYAYLTFYKNTADGKAQALTAKADQIEAEIKNKILFIELGFKEFDDKNAQRLIAALPTYQHYLERLRELKPFTLKEDVEQIINIKDTTGISALISLYEVFTSDFMFDFEGKKITKEELIKFVRDPLPEKRDAAYRILLGRYQQNKNTISLMYQTVVNNWKNEMELRKYSSPISIRNKRNDLDDREVEELLKVFKKSIILFQDYFKEKSRLLSMKKLRRFDLYAPFRKTEKRYTFPDAKEMVLKAFQPFPEFVQCASSIIENHLDSEPNPGKRGGAFCHYPNHLTKPYIMMNFVGDVNSVRTLAHELGHGIHAMLSSKENNYFHYDPVLPMAETASTFGEMLLLDFMKKQSPELMQELTLGQLDDAYATIARQFHFVLFEKEAHELIRKGGSREDLENLYLKMLKEHFGDAVEVDDIFKYEYLYIPHIYHTPFYCYAYGFGLLLSLGLYARYLKDPAFKKNIIQIFSAGSNESPRNILKKSGIEMNEQFWQSGFNYLQELLKEVRDYRLDADRSSP